MKSSRIPQQVIPLIILFGLGIITLLVARKLLVPKTFGEYGHYRAAAVDEIASLKPVYAGYKQCIDCHSDIYETKQKASHKGLSCEVCHGAALAHAEDPENVKPIVPTGRELCAKCHGYNVSRPSGFPQVIAETHNPGKGCMTCHNPHSPAPAKIIDQCAACHARIANQKAVSHHATLACTQCHIVPEQHFVTPRTVAAEKPSVKEVCGQCHDRAANSSPEIPRIDIATHGGRYMCWDCHYPHFPEAD